jgi:FHA domain-containing protein
VGRADALMPNLRDFERRLGGLVEGLFSKAFRSGLQPVEIAKRIVHAMESGRTVGMNEVWAPNHFEVSLSSEDAPRFSPIEAALTTELQRVILETAAERGWGLVGPPEVSMFVDQNLRKGDVEVEASMVEGERAVEPVAPARPHLLVHDGGTVRDLALTQEVTTIGRLPACDVVLQDTAASRRHAQIRVEDGSATLTDLGSTNGTKLNGTQVQSRALADGDRITIGATLIEYRGA